MSHVSTSHLLQLFFLTKQVHFLPLTLNVFFQTLCLITLSFDMFIVE